MSTHPSHAPPDRRDYSLAKIIPPRVGEKTLSATENLISAVSSEDDVLSFEMVGTHNGVTLMHRAERDDALFRTMMTAHFPSAIVEAVPSDADPLVPGLTRRHGLALLRLKASLIFLSEYSAT